MSTLIPLGEVEMGHPGALEETRASAAVALGLFFHPPKVTTDGTGGSAPAH